MSNFLTEMKAKVLERVHTIPVQKKLTPNTLDFCQIFSTHSAIIAEIKFASPSRGNIYPRTLDHVAIAASYLKQGASALSVLTEPHYFKGHINYLSDIRAAFPTAHLLLKDFVLSEQQLMQALAYGANAVLLIVAFLDPILLRQLYDSALSMGLTPMIEVHDEQELALAQTLNPKIIGINNRNLNTLKIDLETSRTLIKQVSHAYMICESGLQTAAQLHEMTQLGFHGFLIGSHLMATDDPGEALAKLRGDDNHAR